MPLPRPGDRTEGRRLVEVSGAVGTGGGRKRSGGGGSTGPSSLLGKTGGAGRSDR